MKIFGKKKILDIAVQLPLEELVKRTRIVVIDDVETEFPFKILKAEGYSIDYWQDVKEITKLEQGFYDIIILDIGGVGQDFDSKDEGVAILRHLKMTNPTQVVIAYSGQAHDSERIPFFKLADQYVPKPSNALSWKETLDNVIRSQCNIEHYWSGFRSLLLAQGIEEKKLRSIETEIIRSKDSASFDAKKLITENLGKLENLATAAAILCKVKELL